MFLVPQTWASWIYGHWLEVILSWVLFQVGATFSPVVNPVLEFSGKWWCFVSALCAPSPAGGTSSLAATRRQGPGEGRTLLCSSLSCAVVVKRLITTPFPLSTSNEAP